MSKNEKKDKQTVEETVSETTEETVENIEIDTDTITKELQAVIAKKNDELAQADDKYKRLVAEYDNFKKRSIKEKEALYTDSVCDVVKELLPVLDNMERAMNSFEDKDSEHYKGFEMILRQLNDTFGKIGVTEIEAVGCEFDPLRHNAVMHIDDDAFGENTIAEEFAKGYTYKDKVIRYSMVKVAN